MNCPFCGTYVNSQAQFCPSCGQRFIPQSRSVAAPGYGIVPTVYDPVGMRQATRAAEMNELSKMISYFSLKSDLYDEYDWLSMRLDRRHLKKRIGLLVWGIILSVVGLLFIMIGMAAEVSGITLFGVIFFLGACLMIVGFVVSTSKRNSNYATALSRFDEVSDELYSHYLNYGACLVSAEFTNPSNLSAIMNAIQSGRADTIKEAVNMLVEDARRYNRRAFARQTSIVSENAARGAAAAAVFYTANLFLR